MYSTTEHEQLCFPFFMFYFVFLNVFLYDTNDFKRYFFNLFLET